MELLPIVGGSSCLSQYLIRLKILFQRHACQIHVVVVAKFYPKLLKSEQYRSSRIHNLCEVHPVTREILLAKDDLVTRIVQDEESHFALHSHLLQSSRQGNIAEIELVDYLFG